MTSLIQRIFGKRKEPVEIYAKQAMPFFNAFGIDLGYNFHEIDQAKLSPNARPIIMFSNVNASLLAESDRTRVVITGKYSVVPRTISEGGRFQAIDQPYGGSFKFVDGKLESKTSRFLKWK